MRPWDEKAKEFRAAVSAAFDAYWANRTPENDAALAAARAAWFEYRATEILVGYTPRLTHFLAPGRRETRKALCGALISASSISSYESWRRSIPNPRRLLCAKCMTHPVAVEQNGEE